MPESLVITTRQNVLDVVDRLRGEEGLKIKVESDFTRGLKAIFYGLPEVVFIQDDIGGISGEKVAGQVKTLLEEEPIRLVLLREEPREGDSADLGFDAVIDVGLPFDELVNRFLFALKALPGSAMEPPAGSTKGESADKSPSEIDTGSSLEFDPFSDVFPAQFHNNWGAPPPETLQSPHMDQWKSQEPIELPPFDDEFCFEPPGDIVTSIPLGKPNPPEEAGKSGVSPASPESTAAAPATGKQGQGTDLRLAGKESPHQLFASMTDDDIVDVSSLQSEGDTAAVSIGDRLRLKGVQTQSTLLKIETGETLPPFKAQLLSKTSSGGGSAPDKPPRPSSLKSPKRSDVAADPRGVPPFRGDLSIDPYLSKGNTLSRKVMPVLLLALVAVSTFMIIQYWDDLTGLFIGRSETAGKPPLMPHPVGRNLPGFFPRVTPDTEYAASHPGWELYHDRGLNFLAYREKGRLMAVQVVAVAEGKISESFLRLCIRETTGVTDGENWVRRKRDDILVENGTLGDNGEVAVYRTMPDAEIRGFVLSFK
jgi:hypothetical protein